jgi:hypothetical protein
MGLGAYDVYDFARFSIVDISIPKSRRKKSFHWEFLASQCPTTSEAIKERQARSGMIVS